MITEFLKGLLVCWFQTNPVFFKIFVSSNSEIYKLIAVNRKLQNWNPAKINLIIIVCDETWGVTIFPSFSKEINCDAICSTV